MTTAAWIMLATTWTVIIAFTVRFYVMALGRPSHRDEEPP
jgi:hypothetical protein